MSSPSAGRSSLIGPVSTEALSRLQHLLQRPLGCGAVLGPTRSGKSALVRVLATASARSRAQTAHIDGQGLDDRGLVWELAAQWQIGPAADGHARRLSLNVRDFACGAAAAGVRLAILVDHADRLEHSGVLALVRLLHEFDGRRGLTLIWAAESPPRGEAADHLLPFTELRIDVPTPTPDETADFAGEVWRQSADVSAGPLSSDLAQQLAALSRNDLRRAERLSRLSQLAALAEGTPVNRDMLNAAAAELV